MSSSVFNHSRALRDQEEIYRASEEEALHRNINKGKGDPACPRERAVESGALYCIDNKRTQPQAWGSSPVGENVTVDVDDTGVKFESVPTPDGFTENHLDEIEKALVGGTPGSDTVFNFPGAGTAACSQSTVSLLVGRLRGNDYAARGTGSELCHEFFDENESEPGCNLNFLGKLNVK